MNFDIFYVPNLIYKFQAADVDSGMNAELHYFIISEPLMSLSEGLENIQAPPFIMDERSGSILLNFDPQRAMKGYFDFFVRFLLNYNNQVGR